MDTLTNALLRLLTVPKLGAVSIDKLLSFISPEELLTYSAEDFKQIGWTEKQIQRWFSPNPQIFDQVEKWLSQPNQYILHRYQGQYPDLLKQISTAPPLLFVKGNVEILNSPQIAIVGSRHCSDYGEYWAKYFASQLSANGLTITSGLAIGIDGFCHKAVTDQGGQTIAVLGCGLNIIYPSRHKKLATEIIENQGALVSEFLPEQPPIAENFPRRNRIISGLSLATLVVEANEKSGSLITARYALEQNREVFAIPSNIQNPYSHGCHSLIKQGAYLVESVKDILENIPHYCPVEKVKTPENDTALLQSTIQKAEPIYKELYHCLPPVPISLDEIATKIDLPVEQLLVQLMELELQGLISQKEGMYQRL